MHRLFPDPGPLDHLGLERLYRFPETGTDSARPWVCANFVSSVDGAVSADGRSAGLSDDADRTVFLLGRTLSDVVLVGAGTVRSEDYGGVRINAERAAQRERAGLSGVPPVAVVSGSCALDPGSRLFTESAVPPIVFTTGSAARDRRDAVAAAGAEVIPVGAETDTATETNTATDADGVDPGALLAALAGRGLRRVAFEGGPRLFGTLIAAGAVDELRLTLSAQLCSGDAARIATGPAPDSPVPLQLSSVVHAGESLLLRYLARRQ